MIFRNIYKYLRKIITPDLPRYFRPVSSSENIVNMSKQSGPPILNTSISKGKNRIVWLDMEMSGLEIEYDRILEIACFVTDENLNIISEDFQMVVHQPDNVFANMVEWCQKTHSESGLIDECKKSTNTEKFVEENLLYFLMKYIPKGKCPVAGNSVYMDRLFLKKYMPVVNDYMHYRIIDVTTVKELTKRWKSTVYRELPGKVLAHRAMSDIKESREELLYYQKHIFGIQSKDD